MPLDIKDTTSPLGNTVIQEENVEQRDYLSSFDLAISAFKRRWFKEACDFKKKLCNLVTESEPRVQKYRPTVDVPGRRAHQLAELYPYNKCIKESLGRASSSKAS